MSDYSTWTLSTEHLHFTTDTIINAVQYKRVDRSLDANQSFWSFYGYIREDADKRVYYRINEEEPEHLLYALNLTIGDSADVAGLMDYHQNQFIEMRYYVTAIDSFLIGNTFRKQLHLSMKHGAVLIDVESWIDSMGSLGDGMLHNWNGTTGGDGFTLLCFSENNVLLYQDPSYTTCYVVTGIFPGQEEDAGITIFPNPASGEIILEISNGSGITDIEITNITGRPRINACVPPGQNRSVINVSGLNPGIYLLKAAQGKQLISIQKVVVK